MAALLGVAAALWCIVTLTARLSPALSTLAKAQVEQKVTQLVATRVQEALSQGGGVVALERDDTGRTTALAADTAALNQVRETLLRGLGEDLQALGKEKIGVPLGSLTPWRGLQGVGPAVRVGIYASPTVTAEFSSRFSQAGVNQTRHVIDLEVVVKLQLLLPQGLERQEVATTVPVAETVIVGTPPEEYLETGTVKE